MRMSLSNKVIKLDLSLNNWQEEIIGVGSGVGLNEIDMKGRERI